MKNKLKVINIIVPIIFFFVLIYFKGIFDKNTNQKLIYDPMVLIMFFVIQFCSNMSVIEKELKDNQSSLDSYIELFDVIERIMTSIGVFALVFSIGDIENILLNHPILSTLYIVFYFYLLTFSLAKILIKYKNKKS